MRKISEGTVLPVPGETALPAGAEADRNLDEESRTFRGLLDGRSGDGTDETPGGKPFAGTGDGPQAPVPLDPGRPAGEPETSGGAMPLPGGPPVPEARGEPPEPAGASAESAGKGERTGAPGSDMPGMEKDAPQAAERRESAPPGGLRGDAPDRQPASFPRESAGRGSTPEQGAVRGGETGWDGLSGTARQPEARARMDPPDRREEPKGDETGEGDGSSGQSGVFPPEERAAVSTTTGEAILRFFEGTGPPGGEAAGPMRAAESLSAAAREIADWIVATGRFGEERKEVRIFLKDRVLAGTEVRISREGGDIRLEIRTGSADSHAFLSGRMDDLARTLKDRVGENVTVDLRFSGSGREEGDGRSRQRRNPHDETDR